MTLIEKISEAEKILQKEECPFVKSCSSKDRKDFDEQLHVCIKNYEDCPTYTSRMDQRPKYD